MPLGDTDFRSRFFTLQLAGDDSEITAIRFSESHLSEEDNIEILGTELFSLVEKYHRDKIILNTEVVEYVTSSVLGKIITLHRKLRRIDGRLVLCGVRNTFADVLRTSRLFDYFEIVDTFDDAIAAFSSDPPDEG